MLLPFESLFSVPYDSEVFILNDLNCSSGLRLTELNHSTAEPTGVKLLVKSKALRECQMRQC